MKDRIWPSSGRESFVFRAAHPRELFGSHGELIEAAMGSDERLLYLLYSPMWEGERAHFGITSQPASHALAVTDRRFIISRNHHTRDGIPTVHSIPFHSVLAVESGNALLQGWFVIRFSTEKNPDSICILYKSTTGRDLFCQAARSYRSLAHHLPPSAPDSNLRKADRWNNIPVEARKGIEALILAGESPCRWISSTETWIMKKRRFRRTPVCLRPAGAMALTNRGILYAVTEPPLRHGMLNFAVNISCIPLEIVRSATIIDGQTWGDSQSRLRVECVRNRCALYVDVPFDPDEDHSARDLAACLQRYASAHRLACERWSP
ncbi:MAG: hypothetical protein HPY84_04605 [Syntrophobacteraceae bacterium]|nr:hypothetical protein [Syntrophobacteraceae bacterium]